MWLNTHFTQQLNYKNWNRKKRSLINPTVYFQSVHSPVNSLNSWNTLGYMAADITSSGVMSSPCVARRPSSRDLKSIGGREAPGRPSMRGRDFSTWNRMLKRKRRKWRWNERGKKISKRGSRTNYLLKLYKAIQSFWIFFITSPWEVEACEISKVMVKPSHCTSQLYIKTWTRQKH